MKKSFFAGVLLALIMSLLCLTVGATETETERTVTASGSCGSSVSWRLYSDGELLIAGNSDMDNYAVNVIYPNTPWHSYANSITRVTIEDGVCTIGDYAFSSLNNLSWVTIPDSVTTIGESAFDYCDSLTGVNIADISVWCETIFENYASNPLYKARYLYLNGNLVSDLTIPNGVTKIETYAFFWCASLTNVIIPESVTNIGENAFYHCDNLTSVTFHKSVSTIKYNTFYDCDNLTDVYYNGTELDRREMTFEKRNTDLTSAQWHYLENLGQGQCGEFLTWVLRSGELIISGNGEMEDFTLYNRPWGSHKEKIEKITIKEGVTSIGEYAFSNCQSLYEVSMPDSLTSIGDYAFSSCEELTDINIPINVKYLGNGAFSDCFWLEKITIPDGITAIGKSVFRDCTCLTEVFIPHSVTSIGTRAFYDCKNLTEINIPDSVVSVDHFAFYGCNRLKNVVIPNSVKYLGDWTFSNCSEVTTVTISGSVNTIGENAFSWCEALTDVVLLDGVLTIGKSAFESCSKLSSVSLPVSVNSIEDDAFRYSDALSDVNYGGSEVDREAMSIEANNEYLTNARWHYAEEHICVFNQEVAEDRHLASAATTETSATYYKSCLCGEAGTETFSFGAPLKELIDSDDIMARMVLKNELNMQFGVPVSAVEDWSGVYAVITKEYADREAKTVTVNMEDCAVVSGMYAIEFAGVAAKEMCDTVTLDLYDAEGNVISEQKVDSVMDYALRTLRKSGTSAESKTQLVDMLNYGAAAQVEFEYSPDALANADLTEAEQALATQSVETENRLVKGANYAGSRLVLKNRIELQIGFKGIDKSCRATYTYTNHYGDEKTVEVEGEDFISVSGLLGVSISQPVVADCRNVITVTVYDANGETVGYAEDSVESYVNRMSEGGDLFEAIMKFSDSSYAALH